MRKKIQETNMYQQTRTLDRRNMKTDFETLTKGKNFDIYQLKEIQRGLDNGLSVQKVELYADPNFNFFQKTS